MALSQQEQDKIIADCKDFLQRSAERYKTIIDEQEECLEALGGKFWEQRGLKKTWRIGKRPTIHIDIFRKNVNSIVSPFTRSPSHINLNDQKLEKIQLYVNDFEGANNTKLAYKNSFRRGVAVGAGFGVIGIDDDGSLMFEFAEQQSSVALDPYAKKPDASDADEGATIRYYSIRKAQEKFGEDVIPANYPDKCSGLDLSQCKMWANKKDYIQVVNYYVKSKGCVYLYKICGKKVVDVTQLLTDIIPIVRFAGFSVYDKESGVNYEGIVQALWDVQLGKDLTWTRTFTRMQQTLKSRMVAGLSTVSSKAIQEYVKNQESDSSSITVYDDTARNGVIPKEPTIVSESFNTADLMSVLDGLHDAEPEVSGIPNEGLSKVERTATEYLGMQENSENNVEELYSNAEMAVRTIGRIVTSLLNNGQRLQFSVEGGPAIITSNMKRRQEIAAIAQYYPEDKKMLLAIPTAETIDSKMAEKIREFTKANLPDGLTLPNDSSYGAIAYALKQTQNQFNQAIQQAQQLQTSDAEKAQQIRDLEDQVRQLTLANADMKRQQNLEWAEFQADMMLKIQQTDFSNEESKRKFILEQQKLLLSAKQKDAENQRKAAEAILKAGV